MLQEIRKAVDKIPDESLSRQQTWRELEPEIIAALGPYNDAFFIELDRQLPLSGLSAAEETIGMMRSVGIPMAGVLPAEMVMADSTKFLLNTKINNKRVVDMFLSRTGKPSPFTASNTRMIDSIVTGGIIYIRFHGTTGRYSGSYPKYQLQNWANWLKDQAKKVRSIYVYFNNDEHAHAIKNAKQLKEQF